MYRRLLISRAEARTRYSAGGIEIELRTTMRIALGADHAGFSLQQDLRDPLTTMGHEVVDLGSSSLNAGEVRLTRAHNDANVLTLGARSLDAATALNSISVFLDTNFEGGRHARRVAKIGAFEHGRA